MSNEPIYRQVIRDVEARAEVGKKTYGRYLMADVNGRDPVQDAYEEALDMAHYLKQVSHDRLALIEYFARLEGAVGQLIDLIQRQLKFEPQFYEVKDILATSPLSGQPQPAPATGWRPIAEAPRDGAQVLVCNPFDVEGHISDAYSISCHVAAWWAEENDGRGAWIIYNNMVRDPELHYDPTHWMPLPAPPQEGE